MIIISSCLAEKPCRYDGSTFSTPYTSLLTALAAQGKAILVCPEVLGGLPTPRACSEIIKGCVISDSGIDLTVSFIYGAAQALQIIRTIGTPSLAVLKSRSPSCGCKTIYDGTFTGRVISGKGVFAQRLCTTYPDLTIIDETQLNEYKEFLHEQLG